MAPVKKKGATSFGGKTKKHKKTQQQRHLGNETRTKLNKEIIL